jgi:hypothetical protein
MKIGLRKPSLKKRIAARTSPKRFVRHNLGFKAPRGYGWITNPKKAAYNRIYSRTTYPVGGKSGKGLEVVIIFGVFYLAMFAIKLIWNLIVVIFRLFQKNSSPENVGEIQLSPINNLKASSNSRLRVKMRYSDATGNMTERIVQVTGYDPIKFHGSFTGFCEMKQAQRTFRLDRVHSMIDLSTSQSILDLKTYLENKFAA